MEIKNEKIIKAMEDNMNEILKDVLTSYNNPIKKALEEKEFAQELKDLAKNILREIITDEEFQKSLKDRILSKAVENMIRS